MCKQIRVPDAPANNVRWWIRRLCGAPCYQADEPPPVLISTSQQGGKEDACSKGGVCIWSGSVLLRADVGWVMIRRMGPASGKGERTV